VRIRIATLVSLLVIVPAGFYCKFYKGPGARWANDSFAGALYVVFWCLVVFALRPSSRPRAIALGVLAATCILEFLQLWHPPLLQWLRSFFLGRAILGSYFDWMDFPYYFLGAALGWTWLAAMQRINARGGRFPQPPKFLH